MFTVKSLCLLAVCKGGGGGGAERQDGVAKGKGDVAEEGRLAEQTEKQ